MPQNLIRMCRWAWTPTMLSLALSAIAALGSLSSPDIQARILTTIVDVVLVVGLYSFIGLSGVVSFGHVSFAAIGAYVTAYLTIPPVYKHVLLPDLPRWLGDLSVSPVIALGVAGMLATVFALVIAPVIVRLNGIAASIVMLCILSVVYVFISQNQSLTRGNRGVTGLPFDLNVGRPLAIAVVVVFVVALFQDSARGLALRATREDEFGARGIGISVARARLWGLLLSACVMGVGGGLYALVIGALTPGSFYLNLTFTTLVMLVVGGMGSLTGAVAGAIVMSAAAQLLSTLEEGVALGGIHVPARQGVALVGVALVALLVLLFRPSGLTNGRELPQPRWLRSPADAAPAAPPSSAPAAPASTGVPGPD
ncbi:hypothetical protein BST13_02950 [Mycobacterium aquaticum]|uniref:Branched-chain amino acid ABC transporter permease n=2 Tax=Mycobacterium aquaticum TaxID=1927124 RepID=A0A1X0BA71_9MYCO|nr:hypothetical protein BST13_02950 [Mycobacterium aquaticum]